MKGRRPVILVVGMHRSGTSAVTRLINLLGAELPGTLVPGGLGNELGHWETAEIVDLHDQMLWSAGVNVNALFAIRPEWFHSSEAEGFVQAVAELMTGPRPAAPMTVIKDPRMALFIPIWLRALDRVGQDARFVLPFRHPLEVANSLRRRQLQHFPDSVWPLGRGTALWLRYVLTAERETRKRRRTFVSFDAVLADWRTEAHRMAAQLGLAWPRLEAGGAEINAFLHRDRKHEVAASGSPLPPHLSRLLQSLERCVRRPDAEARVFDTALEQMEHASALFMDYVQELEFRIATVPSLVTEFPDFPPPPSLGPPHAVQSGPTAPSPGDRPLLARLWPRGT